MSYVLSMTIAWFQKIFYAIYSKIYKTAIYLKIYKSCAQKNTVVELIEYNI